MVTVNWGRALQKLSEVVAMVPDYALQVESITELRSAFTKAALPQQVYVSHTEEDGDFADVKRAVISFGAKPPSANLFRITDSGDVFFGPFSKETIISLPTHLSELLFAGFGHSLLFEDRIQEGAAALYRCMMKGNGKCQRERGALQNTVVQVEQKKAEDARKAAEAEKQSAAAAALAAQKAQEEAKIATREDAYQSAVWVWKKVDDFLNVADAADSRDSDSDVLKEIVRKHVAARPLVKPDTIEGAVALKEAAYRMLFEFQASPHLKAFVMEEGQCKDTIVVQARCPNEGEKYTSCSLGGYSFNSGTISYGNCKEVHDKGDRDRSK